MWRMLGDSQAPGTQRQRRGEHRVFGEEREGAMGLLLISPPQLISALINLLAVCKWSRQSKDNEEVPEPPFPKLSLLPCCGLDVPILSGLPCPSEHLGGQLGQVAYRGSLLGKEENLFLKKRNNNKKVPIFSNLAIITALWLWCCADAVLESGPVLLTDLHHEMHIFR